jgi:hypothetical protein
MATNTVTYSQVLIAIGDGASPEVFAHPCLINGSKALTIEANFSEDVIPDCDNPANPANVVMNADSVRLTCSGAGKLHRNDAKTYADWAAGATTKNAKIRVGAADASGSFEITCSLVCTSFAVNTERPNTAEADVSFAASDFDVNDIAAYTS